MSAPKLPESDVLLKRLAITVNAHAWNRDRTSLAVCPNNNTICIYAYDGSSFELKHELVEHDSLVVSLDWAPKTNQLLSTSQDRNAYVWRYENGEWKPTLVILRLDRSASQCKWSPNEDKFAVASSSKLIAVCYFEKEYDWWVAKHIKTFNSTVLCLDWHPNNIFLASGGTDSHLRVHSAYFKGVDSRDAIKTDAFGTKLPFGTLCKDIDAQHWVHAVAWSVDGNALAWVAHDCSVHVLFCGAAPPSHVHFVLRTPHLPFLDLRWLSKTALIAVGHSAEPFIFETTADQRLRLVGSIDHREDNAGKKSATTLSSWRRLDDTGQVGDDGPALSTRHQNAVNCVQAFELPDEGRGHLPAVSTSGLDGAICIWNLKRISSVIPLLQSLKI